MKIGHTGITWGIPGDVETAYRETAELGYLGFETFARTIIEWNQKPGGYRALVERFGIPTSAAYCYKQWIDPATSGQELAAARGEAEAAKQAGASALVLQAGSRPEQGYGDDEMRRLAAALNAIGSYCREIGLVAALHPHTGTAIETREEIDAILQLTDAELVGFAPDTGQIAKGGSDIVEVLNTHRDRIAHVHLKDWCGRYERDAAGKEIDTTGYVNYEPIGNGVLPMPEILRIVQESGRDCWVNVELDGTNRAPRPPREAAAMSRRYLGEILGDQVAWRR
ncbi:MAG: sugar phosphate isomerase/epimerase family protein [Thermomicrobiales bacterium]